MIRGKSVNKPCPDGDGVFLMPFVIVKIERKVVCMALNPKQQRFCEEYMIDLNATQAAIRAGYSVATACEQASRLLANVKISREIERLQAIQSRRTGITADRVLIELAKIAFVDPDRVINANDGTVKTDASADDRAAIQGVKVKQSTSQTGDSFEAEVKLYDKTRALELLGKHLGLFSDKVDLNLTQPIVVSGGEALED